MFARWTALAPLLLLALAAPALTQDAKRAPLEPKVGRVLEVEAEFRLVDHSIMTDTDEGITYRTRDVITKSERVVYLDRLEALGPKGGALRRTQFVLDGSCTNREESQDEEDGKKLPPEKPVETKTKCKLIGRHIRRERRKDGVHFEEGEPKVKLMEVDPALFVFDIETFFPKTLPKDGKISGEEFLALTVKNAFPGWPRELVADALAEVIGTAVAYGRQSIKSVRWGARAASPAKGKGLSITYRIKLEVHTSSPRLTESMTSEWSARYSVRKPSKAFPEPAQAPPK